MHVYVCLHTRTSVCVCVRALPRRGKSQDSSSPPATASVSSLSALRMTLTTPPTSRMASRRGQPLAQKRRPHRLSHTVEFNPDCTRVSTEHQSLHGAPASPWSTSAAGLLATQTTAPWPGSAQDQEREALGNPSSSGLPLPSLRRGQKTEDRGNCKRGAWLSRAEGVWRKRGGAQLCGRISGSLRCWRQIVMTHQNTF